jgi:hypothetical protein
MLKTLAVLATITHQTFAADDSLSVRTLTQKALEDKIGEAMLFRLDQEPQFSRVCAIPLLEPRTLAVKHIDPIFRPVPSKSFDKMARPPEVKACQRP